MLHRFFAGYFAARFELDNLTVLAEKLDHFIEIPRRTN